LSVVSRGASPPSSRTRRDRRGARGAVDLAPVDQVIVLFAARVDAVDPAPAAQASLRRTRGQVARDLEVDVLEPGTSVVDADDGELQLAWTDPCAYSRPTYIFRLDLVLVALVCDRQPASLDILRVWRAPLVRGVHSPNAAGRPLAVARINARLLVRDPPQLGQCLVTGHLAMVCPARGEGHEFARSGRFVDVSMEPPLVEVEVHERQDGLRLVRVVRVVSAVSLSLMVSLSLLAVTGSCPRKVDSPEHRFVPEGNVRPGRHGDGQSQNQSDEAHVVKDCEAERVWVKLVDSSRLAACTRIYRQR